MSRFRHVVIAAALAVTPAVAGTAAIGCSQPVVPTNIIAAAEAVAQTAATVIADAQAVWPLVLASIPAAQQSSAQNAFDKAVFAANHAILALNDAIQVAIAANATNPDFTAIFSQVADAVAQVVSIIQSFQSPSLMASEHVVSEHVRASSSADAISDMVAASARLRALSVKK